MKGGFGNPGKTAINLSGKTTIEIYGNPVGFSGNPDVIPAWFKPESSLLGQSGSSEFPQPPALDVGSISE